MALLDIRKDFVSLSGRHDLVVDFQGGNYTDKGANFFIRMGQRMLDRKGRTPKWSMRFQRDISAGDFKLDIDNIRSLKEVWLVGSGGRKLLTKRSIGYLRETYATAWGTYPRGVPVDWAVGVNALAPQDDQLYFGPGGTSYTAFFTRDYEDIVFADQGIHYGRQQVVFMPPADQGYTIGVWGFFFQKILSDLPTDDKNFWTEVHPEVLVLSALWAHEISLRNTEGANDWIRAIDEYLLGVEFDIVEEQQTGLTRIPG